MRASGSTHTLLLESVEVDAEDARHLLNVGELECGGRCALLELLDGRERLGHVRLGVELVIVHLDNLARLVDHIRLASAEKAEEVLLDTELLTQLVVLINHELDVLTLEGGALLVAHAHHSHTSRTELGEARVESLDLLRARRR